jgi:oligopeptide transport system substrate-binding protein
MVAIAGGWKDSLGVETELVSTEFRIFLEERKDHKKWDAIRLGWYADYDDPASFLNIFSLAHSQNDPRYFSAEFNKLLKAAASESDTDVRRKIFEHAEKILLDDYPVIPIYFYNSRRLVKTIVGGAAITPMNRTYSKNLYWK